MLIKILTYLTLLLIGQAVSARQWIIFYAYPRHPSGPGVDGSPAGHAFVSFIQQDEALKMTNLIEKWGFHPKEDPARSATLLDKAMAFFSKEGEVKDEWGVHSEFSFVVEVKDILVFQECLKVKDVWNKKRYSVIAAQTCVDFIRDVGLKIPGIRLPSKFYKWPAEFLANLKIENAGIDEKGRQSLTLSSFPTIESFYGHWQGFAKFGSWGFKQEMNFEISTGSSPDEVIVVASHLALNGFAKNRVIGKYRNGRLTIDFFTPKLSMKAACYGKMFLQVINHDHLQGVFGTGDQDCDTANYSGLRRKDVSPIDTTFKIDPKYVTLSADKKFKWYKWEQAPKDFKNAARTITTKAGKSLLSVIDECYKYPDPNVEIAAVDLDGDGICGLAVFLQSSGWCGTAGCHFELYDNGGMTTVDLGSDIEVKPSKHGVVASTGRFFPLIANTQLSADGHTQNKLTSLYTYDATKRSAAAPKVGLLVGGATPEELGKLVLKALKTNDKQLWSSCIHPNLEKDYKVPDSRQFLIDNFRRLRNGLVEQGITQWGLVEFGRVTFRNYHPNDGTGIKYASEIKIEFTYKNKEYIGVILISSAKTYQGKYFLTSGFEDYGVARNNAK
jgi:hypothetical protein